MAETRQTILVVDDVPDDILILEEILRKDYQVKAVTNGEAALRIARSGNPPDLILLDVMMPTMDGFEVCRILKQDSEGTLIPVIFLTAKGLSSDEKIGLELGAVDYIRKPVDPEIVRAKVRSHLDQKDRTLRSSEVRFRRLFETSMDGILISDTETGHIVDVNPAMAALLGVTQEYFLGRRLSELGFLEGILSLARGLPSSGQGEYVRPRGHPITALDGRRIHVEFYCNTYKVNNRELTQLNLRDVTELVEAEGERDALSGRLSHYLSTSPTVTYSLRLKDKEAQWLWVSENIQALLGYSSEEALEPDWWFRNIDSTDRAAALGAIADLARHETSSREYRFMRKDRTRIWLRDEMRLVKNGPMPAEIVGTLTDISARKNAEEEIHLKGEALEATANAVVIASRAGIIKWVNKAYETLTGYPKAEALGLKLMDQGRSGLQDEATFRDLWDTILAGRVWRGEFISRRKSGQLYTEEMTITPVLDSGNGITEFVAIKNDITERKKAQESLESALREKSGLLREIHHRVNNNIQVMISLLNISSEEIGDRVLRGKLDDIIRRIHSMSLIHQQFYESRDISRIDFAVFLRELLKSRMLEYAQGRLPATEECEAGSAFLDLEQAIPAALIVSELLTDAIHHAQARPDGDGAVRVSQKKTGRLLEIEVGYKGPGPGAPAQAGTAMGMALISILLNQLDGRIELRENGWTDTVLAFPILEPGGEGSGTSALG